MLLRDWLRELGLPDRPISLQDVQRFSFGEDAYVIYLVDGNTLQDNDLERMLSMIHDEFHTQNMTAILRGGQCMHPYVEYPFASHRKSEMHIRPVLWTAVIPLPDLDLAMEQVAQRITLFNLTGQWTQPYKKENL